MDARFFDDHIEIVADPLHPDAAEAKPIDRLLIELFVSPMLHPVRVATDEDKVTYEDAYQAYLDSKKK